MTEKRPRRGSSNCHPEIERAVAGLTIKSWSDVIDLVPPVDEELPSMRPADWSHVSRDGYERSDRIRGSIRKEFPISLAFFPLWDRRGADGDLLFPTPIGTRTQANCRGVLVVVLAGLLSWLGAEHIFLFTISN